MNNSPLIRDDEYECARTIARIVGPGSGAAMAVGKYDQLRKEGKNPFVFMDSKRQSWVVVE